jgi:hypothetical protein
MQEPDIKSFIHQNFDHKKSLPILYSDKKPINQISSALTEDFSENK